MNDPPLTIADVVRIARASRRWTVRDMSERAGIAPMTLQRAEKGEPVRTASWRGLAKAFEVDEETLLQVTGQGDAVRLADLLGVHPRTSNPPGTRLTSEDYESTWDEEGREVPVGDVVVRKVQDFEGRETYTNVEHLMRVVPLKQIATGVMMRLEGTSMTPAQSKFLDAAIEVFREEAHASRRSEASGRSDNS